MGKRVRHSFCGACPVHRQAHITRERNERGAIDRTHRGNSITDAFLQLPQDTASDTLTGVERNYHADGDVRNGYGVDPLDDAVVAKLKIVSSEAGHRCSAVHDEDVDSHCFYTHAKLCALQCGKGDQSANRRLHFHTSTRRRSNSVAVSPSGPYVQNGSTTCAFIRRTRAVSALLASVSRPVLLKSSERASGADWPYGMYCMASRYSFSAPSKRPSRSSSDPRKSAAR